MNSMLISLSFGLFLLQFLLLIFSCLRKAAWDYGRLALLMENDRYHLITVDCLLNALKM